ARAAHSPALSLRCPPVRVRCLCCCASARAECPTLSLHDALPICWSIRCSVGLGRPVWTTRDWRVKIWSRVEMNSNSDTSLSAGRSEEHTSELQSRFDLVCRLLLEKKNAHTACRSGDVTADETVTR